MKGYTSVVNVLLASGADVNIKNIQGFTAIMMAAGQGYVEIFQSLMMPRLFSYQPRKCAVSAL